MGPSGCGKSSRLAAICGTLDSALTARGRVLLNGEDVTARPPETRRIGILFQDDLLFPHLSVAGNLAFGLPPAVRGRRERSEEHTSELQSLMRISYAVFCFKTKKIKKISHSTTQAYY